MVYLDLFSLKNWLVAVLSWKQNPACNLKNKRNAMPLAQSINRRFCNGPITHSQVYS